MSRARIAAAKDALPDLTRLAYTDAEAIALATELDPAACRHPAELAAALARLESLPPRPEGDDDTLIAWASQAKAAREAFWDAFEGEVVDGIEIIRRRA